MGWLYVTAMVLGVAMLTSAEREFAEAKADAVDLTMASIAYEDIVGFELDGFDGVVMDFELLCTEEQEGELLELSKDSLTETLAF
jgi:hypothetical protein